MDEKALNEARADGEVVGRYRIVRTLGQGAFTISYAALDTVLKTPVAIKELFVSGQSIRDGAAVRHPDYVAGMPFAELEAQFQDEGRHIAALSDPALVKFRDYFLQDDSAFLVTDFIKGPTLEEFLSRQTSRPDEAALRTVFSPIIAVLEKLHDAGQLHADIKPSNIVIGPKGLVLIDLGAGRAMAASVLGHAGLSAADLSFAPPEQLGGVEEEIGPWSDVFALAAIVYAAMTGAPPVSARDRALALAAGRPDPYTPLASMAVDPAIAALGEIVDRALRLSPGERPQSIASFREGLRWSAPPPAGKGDDAEPAADFSLADWTAPTPTTESDPPLSDAPPAAASQVQRDPAVLLRALSETALAAQSLRASELSQASVKRKAVAGGAKALAVEVAPTADVASTLAPQAAAVSTAPPNAAGVASDARKPAVGARRSRGRALAWILLGGVGVAAAAIGSGLFDKEIIAGFAGLAKLLKLSSLTAPAPAAASDTVDVSVFAPPKAAPGDQFLVQVFLRAFPAAASEVENIEAADDASSQQAGIATLDIPVTHGERLEVAIDAPGMKIDAPLQAVVWRGQSRAVQFLISVPLRHAGGPVRARVRILRASIPVAQLRFAVSVEDQAQTAPLRRTGQTAKRFTRAFLSYAHEDRVEVLKRAQGLRAAKIQVFQDLMSLSPGEEWRARLEAEIDQCDLFLLFWSASARRSVWVNREVDQAIAVRARSDESTPEIMPVILEGPPAPKPPERLKHLHFDDPLAYLIAANPKDRAERGRRTPAS